MPLNHEEFMALFDRWAPTYDQTVRSPNAEGFEQYEEILQRVADLAAPPAGGTVLDVGTGTGNLAQLLQKRGARVTAVEPSAAMRAIAAQKLGPKARVLDGHFLQLPVQDGSQDAIVSTYAFHHLTDAQKAQAVPELLRALKPEGTIVIGDEAWANEQAKEAFLASLRSQGKHDLVAEIENEYPTTIAALTGLFAANGCSVYVEQLTDWVWVLVAARRTRFFGPGQS